MGVAALAFGFGLIVGRATVFEPAPVGAPADQPSLRQELEATQRALEREKVERAQLSAELSGLWEWVEILASSAELAGQPPSEPEQASAVEGGAELGLDEEALLEAGVQSDAARRLADLWREVEMRKLELAVRAAEGGWSNSFRHHQALRRLDALVRAELDDAAYDQYLYATRRPNRLTVRSVIEGSPASEAGILPGDSVLRYRGKRVFTATELNAAVSLGDAADSVRLEILRGGHELSFVVRGGPLGTLVALTRERPYFP